MENIRLIPPLRRKEPRCDGENDADNKADEDGVTTASLLAFA